jgi:hypothetical protein
MGLNAHILRGAIKELYALSRTSCANLAIILIRE